MFQCNHEAMLEDLESGDVAETVHLFFESNKEVRPSNKSLLSLQDVDKSLTKLEALTKEDEQVAYIHSPLIR